MYLILQGSVERKSRDDATGSITSSLVHNTVLISLYTYVYSLSVFFPTQLYAGGHFGKMEEHFVTKSRYRLPTLPWPPDIKVLLLIYCTVYCTAHSYPMYVTREVCSLLRITLFDYERVLQVHYNIMYIVPLRCNNNYNLL